MYEKLIRVSTYAKMNNLSAEAIRIRIKKGILKTVLIDRMAFVDLSDKDYEVYQQWLVKNQ